MLAVDLSLTSLCFAQRQTRALGLTNIDYAQADILRLPSIGRMFDMIDATGVLHHLADPFAGWRALLSMLRPGGLMSLGLYSEIARRDIVYTRDFIAERGYRPLRRTSAVADRTCSITPTARRSRKWSWRGISSASTSAATSYSMTASIG